jgi:hypothetical protein
MTQSFRVFERGRFYPRPLQNRTDEYSKQNYTRFVIEVAGCR